MRYREVHHYKFQLVDNCFTTPVDLPNSHELNPWLDDNVYVWIWDNLLYNRKHYAWDGSSIPYKRLFKILSFGRYDADRYCKEASLGHDGLCQLMREGKLDKKYKQYIDALYRNICIIGGLSVWRADKRYAILRKVGDIGITPEKNPRNEIFDTIKDTYRRKYWGKK